jgi:hypothetical protein
MTVSKSVGLRLLGLCALSLLIGLCVFLPSAQSPSTPLASMLDRATARLNVPFALKLGQTIDFEDVPLRLKFESVEQDLRCPAKLDCATRGTAKLVFRVTSGIATVSSPLEVGGQGVPAILVLDQTLIVTIFSEALVPYPQQKLASQEIAPNEYVATFRVVHETVSYTPTPPPPITCPTLTRSEASEILGEALQDQTRPIVLFQPPYHMIVVHHQCGYVSLAFTPHRSVRAGVPAVDSTSTHADHAVLAGKFTDNQRLEQLYSVAGVIEGGNSRSDGALLDKLITHYYHGTWERDMLSDLVDAARDVTGVTVNWISGLGERAIWVWREFDGGRYAALVAQQGETLFVVSALVSDQRSAEGLQSIMTTVLQKMMR